MATAGSAAGRRVTARGAARREQILDVAAEMFLASGYEGVSVDEIIHRVGGSKTNLYRHYGGKEGLFEAVVGRMCDDFLGDFRTLDVAGLGLEEGLRRLGRQLVATLTEPRHVAFQRLVIAESARFPAMARIWFASGPTTSRGVIAAFVAIRQRAGEARDVDPDATAVLFHDMVVTNGLYLALLGTAPDEAAMARSVDLAVDVILRGIRSA